MAQILVMCAPSESRDSVLAELEARNHTVDLAGDGVAVRRALSGGAFDCALLDEALIEMYGMDVLVRIRKSYRHQTLPIALMTSTVEEHAQLMNDNHLAVDVLLAKPFDPADAIHAIELMLTEDADRQFRMDRNARVHANRSSARR